jgi:hypothetical protein
MHPSFARAWAQRKKAAPLVMGAAVLVIGRQWQDHAPTPLAVELDLGPAHSEATRLEVSYLAEGELVRHVSLRYPDGAPASVRQRVELAQGRYRVLVEGELRDGGTWARERRLEAPASGTIRLPCGPEPRITAGTGR